MVETPRPLFVAATEVHGSDYRHGTRAGAVSVLIHASVIALLFALAGSGPQGSLSKQRRWHISHVLLTAPHMSTDSDRSGGGGGMRAQLPASFGAVPPYAQRQFAPPIPIARDTSFVLQVAPTLVGPADLQLPNVDASMWGVPSAPPGPPSPGIGCCNSIGDGEGTSAGPGHGPGWGPGPGGYGNVYLPGRGGVSAPVPIYKVEPEYSEEARKAKFQGTVEIEIVIDEQGKPTNFKIRSPLGLGLDEKAVDAVKQWRFRPGMKNGKPVAVVAKIEVNFRLL
jgi:periplasmic protein TonB